MSNPIGKSWAEPSFADTSWVAGSWGAPVVVVQQPSGGRRIPNKYESLKPRLARAARIRQQLLEERMKDRPGYAEYLERTSGFFPLPPRSNK